MTEHEQVAEIFRAAGWTAGTRDGWGGQFVWNGTSVVGGIDPWGTARTTGIVHNPLEGPTNIVDAAHWLVEHARALRLAPASEPAQVFFYDPHGQTTEQVAQAVGPSDERGPDDREQGDSGDLHFEGLDGNEDEGGDQGDLGAEILGAAHEDDEETGAEDGAPSADGLGSDDGRPGVDAPGFGDDVSVRLPPDVGSDDAFGTEGVDDAGGGYDDDEREIPDLGAEILDADYSEPIDLLVEGSDFADVALEPDPPGAFIFGDNLDQKRTSAIGLVVQSALMRMPEAIDYARMSELRNFTMGVSEGRWPDDPAKREELDTLEATERLRRAIEAIRDAKIETLLTATREEIEAFDTQAGWP